MSSNLIGNDADRLDYRVGYRVWLVRDGKAALSTIKYTKVSLFKGYTDLGSIPNLVAVGVGIPVEDILVNDVDLVFVTRDGVRY